MPRRFVLSLPRQGDRVRAVIGHLRRMIGIGAACRSTSARSDTSPSLHGSVEPEQAEAMVGELNKILEWVEQLDQLDTTGIAPMTSVVGQSASAGGHCDGRQ